jgi:magnesium transporter
MRIIEFRGDTLRFLDQPPDAPDPQAVVWIHLDQLDFAQHKEQLQQACARLGGSALLELHCDDLANPAHPSHFDSTSVYDRLIFRRLASIQEAQAEREAEAAAKSPSDKPSKPQPPKTRPRSPKVAQTIIDQVRSRAVGFVVFDRLLITVHPTGCYAAKSFVDKFLADAKFSVDTVAARNRLPASAPDLALRMVNVMVDSFLELRKELSAQLEHWQEALLKPNHSFNNWGALMGARNRLHTLEDLCDEQRDAMQEWLDSLREQPIDAQETPMAKAQREQLMARARDVLEHIERVVHSVRRMEQNAETVVQIHFSAQGNRTNDIMRTLTALTAIFLPLNLIAGVFGMNFEFAPFIHSKTGFWWSLAAMASLATCMGLVFWRKRYLARTGR